MADVNICRVPSTQDRLLPVFAESERLMRQIRRRAFELFAERGFGEGAALSDWLTAERELCWPAAELVEGDKEYVLSVSVPGFEPGEIEVTATPRELIVHAKSKSERARGQGSVDKVTWSEFRSNDVYRRVELPTDICVDDVKASLKNGLMKVIAPKASVVAKPVAVAA
jgi:HSP20 family molecular chaperone IbpA